MRKTLAGRFACAALMAISAGSVQAQTTSPGTAAEFYTGRKLVLIVDNAPGGGYDAYGRLFARYYGKHIPGNPNIVVQNMPGAGGLTAANWTWEVAPRDGATIQIMSRSIPLAPLMGQQAARFDPLKFNWIGSLNRELVVIFSWSTSGIENFQTLRTRKANVGVTAATADSALWTRLINGLAGTQLNIISGYRGSDAVNLAIERGENEVATGSWSSLKTRKPDWLRDKKINVLAQFAMQRHPELAQVPTILEVSPDEEAKSVFELFLAPQEMGRPFTAPPGVPPERLAALRAAFMATARDEEFLKAASAARADIDPIDGARMQEILTRVYAMPRQVITRARQASEYRPTP
ncbi:MAG: hypothetical protein FJX29_01710 [Alphaproteobacteria bacterium]|nr:hypothetical protein [Alphaproteobacteria bacterium]